MHHLIIHLLVVCGNLAVRSIIKLNGAYLKALSCSYYLVTDGCTIGYKMERPPRADYLKEVKCVYPVGNYFIEYEKLSILRLVSKSCT